MQLTLRAIHFTLTVDMNNESDLIANLHINPLGVILVGQFRFLNTLFGITIILVSFWITYLDYLFTYKMGDLFLDSAYQMIVANGRHFQKLNFCRFNWPDWKNSWWRSWLYPAKYIGKQILKISKEICSIFNLKFKPLFWPICFSLQIRSKLYVYSAVFEFIVMFVCVELGKVYCLYCFIVINQNSYSFLNFLTNFNFLFLVILVIVFFFFLLFHFYFNPIFALETRFSVAPFTSALLTAWTFLDSLILAYHDWNVFRNVFFFSHIFFNFKFIANNHFKEFNLKFYRQVSAAAAIYAKQKQYQVAQYPNGINTHSRNTVQNYYQKQQQQNHRLLQFLKRFYHDYRWLLSVATETNSQLASRLFFTAIIFNLPINLVMVGELLFRELPQLAVVAFLLIICFQIILVMLVAVLAIAISNSFYLSERLLFKVQLALTADQLTVSTENRKGKQQQQWRYFCHRSSMLLAKLHLTVFYETICTKKKFRFTFGPHAKISYQSMFEFILFYSGFMLYVAKMFKNGRL